MCEYTKEKVPPAIILWVDSLRVTTGEASPSGIFRWANAYLTGLTISTILSIDSTKLSSLSPIQVQALYDHMGMFTPWK